MLKIYTTNKMYFDDRLNNLYYYCKIGCLNDIISNNYALEEIRTRNNNALRIASIYGHIDIIKYFLDTINLRIEDIKNSDAINITKNENVKSILSTYIKMVEDIRSENERIKSISYIPISKKKRSCI